MALLRLNKILSETVKELETRQPLKGNEHVITGLKKAENGFGPRYYLQGYEKKEFLRFNSNSYLSLHTHPEVIRAEEEAVRIFGAGPGAVRFISGTYEPHVKLEEELAVFHQKEAVILFNAAYAAVVGVLHALVSSETIVISDALNHNSIINGVRLARPAGKAVYSHIDMKDFEKSIKSFRGKGARVLVITDGIFSMRGDHAPLAHLEKICGKYDSEFPDGVVLVVDDSHGIGAFGKTGRGVEEYEQAKADILIGTLGKAFGVNGGYAAASKQVIDFLRETAPLYIYSNPITPAEAAAAGKSLSIVNSQEGRELLRVIRGLTKKFESGLQSLHLEILSSEHPIVPLMIRDTAKTAALIKHLFRRQVLATGLNFPVVPKGDQSIRFQINGCHTEKDIDYVLNVVDEFC